MCQVELVETGIRTEIAFDRLRLTGVLVFFAMTSIIFESKSNHYE